MDKVTEILKKVKYFVSFDPDTYYSELAVAHGCFSLISCPQYDGEEQHAINQRPYIAFLPDQIEASWAGRTNLLQKYEDAMSLSRQNVAQFYEFWARRINLTSSPEAEVTARTA